MPVFHIIFFLLRSYRIGEHISDRERNSSRRQETTIDTMKSSIRIQSLKWHSKVRTVTTSAFLIPVKFGFHRDGKLFSHFLFFFFSSSFQPTKVLVLEKIQIVVWSVHSNESARSNSPFCLRIIVRLRSDRNHPVYIVERKIAGNANCW